VETRDRLRGRRRRRTAVAGVWTGAVLLALGAGTPPAVAVPGGGAFAAPEASGTGGPSGSLVMVLDSSGSMADDDGTGRTRMESARTAVGTVVDGLPDGYPTGLRVYGADRARGCTDTRLVRPVRELDRTAVKRAVAAVRPKGDTPSACRCRGPPRTSPGPRTEPSAPARSCWSPTARTTAVRRNPARSPSGSARRGSGCGSTRWASR
jgi:Ca-activated chloride channel homolog